MVAPDLESGSAHVERALGVSPGPGGEHAGRGTHNRLLRLGDDAYLEVIAANPRDASHGRPRLFGLDAPPPRPFLATWVAQVQSLRDDSWRFGRPETLSRGGLTWRLTLTTDGSLPMGGVAPALIEWGGRNPAHRMPESGCVLEKLELFHPQPQAVEDLLAQIGFSGPVEVLRSHIPALAATIRGPKGRCKLC